MSIIYSTEQWFVKAGQMPDVPTPDSRQAAFYIGMQLEELTEKLALVFPGGSTLVWAMSNAAISFKRGDYDDEAWNALRENPRAMLDADLDQMWVTIGAARAQGANTSLGYALVNHANYAKGTDGVFKKDENGKIIKPIGWKEADLTPAIHPSLNQEQP